MKIEELTGALLDYWVAKAEGWTLEDESVWRDTRGRAMHLYGHWTPSTDWAQGGPIIERERINITERDGGVWQAHYSGCWAKLGPTPLVAAMRAYVASKFGNEVPAQEPG